MRDQEKHANTESEVQMGTTRADGGRRLDEETREQCYDAGTVARWSAVNRMKTKNWRREKFFRETHKRNLRPHRQVEQSQVGEYDRRNAVGCSHTIKANEVHDINP